MVEPIHPVRCVEQHFPMIFRTCRRNTPSEESAWEAFQETFLAFSRRSDDLDHEADYGPWLRETARRCCLAVVRKEGRLPKTGVTHLDAVAPLADDHQVHAAYLAEATAVLKEEVKQLSEEDRGLLHWLYAEGLTHREAAARLNCPAGSVHAKAEEARRRLRKRLERRGIVVGALLLLFLLLGNAEAGWALASCGPRETVWRRKIPPRNMVVASLMMLTAFVAAVSLWNVAQAALLAGSSTQAEVTPSAGCGCDIGIEAVDNEASVMELDDAHVKANNL